ncbi:hypothetical protein CW354_20320 [Marinicaulis flavus]|uniref:Multi-ubiquitin domain-containing protein n=2 Tax=Hyphococcus luteus TaxID=2058213 RepID=A0A2S7K075_9PROT|nr:hypothetical protein CW354_20320 [Marinicaulis flavus]
MADETLDFKPVIFDDPKPLGRQFVEAVGGAPVHEYVAIAILPDGDFEDIRLDEQYDLRGRGAERVLVVRTDRKFLFKIDDADLEWPRRFISGFVAKKLARLAPNYALWLDVPGGHDQKIQDCDLIDLGKPGVERFISIIDETTEGRELIPSADRSFLESHDVAFEVLNEGGKIAVILEDFPLPDGKFDHATADILIILPPGYPDVAPDMFYTSPRLKLASIGREPRAANAAYDFGGRTWQRWSRHCNAWRPGIDGLQTMVARVRRALEEARA